VSIEHIKRQILKLLHVRGILKVEYIHSGVHGLNCGRGRGNMV
jgi:hypothetical protein